MECTGSTCSKKGIAIVLIDHDFPRCHKCFKKEVKDRSGYVNSILPAQTRLAWRV